jgi:hypothetical protein
MASDKQPNARKRRRNQQAISVFDKAPRKASLTYTQAVGDIRGMFLEQASVWNFQAQRLIQASSFGNRGGGLSQQVPWSSCVDGRGRLTFVFGENTVANKETLKAQEIKKKLKKSRDWKCKRPVAKDKESEKRASIPKAKVSQEDSSESPQEESSCDEE